MRMRFFHIGSLWAALAVATPAAAQSFSTSAVSPAALPASGSIAANYPAGAAETRYYFTADLKAGVLASQIAYRGAPDATKTLEFTLLNGAGREVGSYYIKSVGENYEGVRAFRIDNSGAYTIRLSVKGPETAGFKVDLGGSSLAGKIAAPASTSGPSTSFINPSPLPADGVIAGTIPPGRGYQTSYYFAAPLKGGQLVSQIGVTSTGSAGPNMIEMALLKPDGNPIDTYYTKSFEKNHEATKTFSIGNTDTYVVRVTVQGAETTRFKAELGGSALQAK